MAAIDLSAATWLRSSHSGANQGNCIEFAPDFISLGVVPVRDSKDPEGPALVFSNDGWTAFTAAAGRGEFDPS